MPSVDILGHFKVARGSTKWYSKNMAKDAKIKWVLDKKRQENGQACYRVSVPAQFSETGKRRNLYFSSKEKATEKASEIKRLRDEKGSGVFSIDAVDVKAVSDFKVVLEGLGISVYEALAFVARSVDSETGISSLLKFIEIGKNVEDSRKKSVSFAKAAKEMIELKETVLKRRPATMKQIRFVINTIAKNATWFSNKHLCDISADDCRKALNASFNTLIMVDDAKRIISGVFSFGRKRAYCSENPSSFIESLRREEKEIVPLSVDEIKSIFFACRLPNEGENAGEDRRLKFDLTACIPAIAIMTFAGVRPVEVTRLTWHDVNFDERIISVRSRSSKTGGTRHINICDVLIEWLTPFRKEKEDLPICPTEWRKKWEGVRMRAGWGKNKQWIEDSLRHTYASYHVKVHRNFPLLQVEMGHGSANLLRQRYSNLKGVTNQEAHDFWKIKPEIMKERIESTAAEWGSDAQ